MPEESPQKQHQDWISRFVTVFSVIFALCFILNVSGILEYMGIYLPSVPQRAIYLMGILILIFLRVRGKKSYRLSWDSALLIGFTLISMGYIALFQERTYDVIARRVPVGALELVLCFLAVFVISEAVRRTLGLITCVIVLLFFFYPTFSNLLPGILQSRPFGLDMLVIQIYLGDNGIFGSLTEIALSLVFIFVMFGSFLEITEAGDWFIKIALSLVGHLTGGPAKAAVIASCLFGTVSGSPSANVATTGCLTIPLMKRTGYKPSFAGGVEASASTGGLIMPPVMGAVAFIIAQWLGISYWEVCVAAFIPAVLYFVAIFIMVHQEAKRQKLNVIPKAELPKFIPTFKQGWYWILPIIILVVLLGAFGFPAGKAGFWTLITVVILSMFKKKTWLTPAKAVQALRGGMQANLTAAIAMGMVGIIVGSLNLTGVGLRLSASIVDVSGGNLLVLLLLTAVASFVLGCGMPAVPAYIMVVAFVAPALIKIGIEPLGAHMFVFYWAMLSFITPPVAIASFVAASIARENPMLVSFQACRLALVAYIVPFAFVYNPAFLMHGETAQIMTSFIFGIIGVIAMGCGAIGYILTKINWFSRILLSLGGFVLLFAQGMNLMIGLLIILLAIVPIVFVWFSRRQKVQEN